MAKYYDRCWNPLFGCSGNFAGCDKCYAKSLMERRGRQWNDFHDVKTNKKQLYKTFDPDAQLIAVCTQSDLFQGEGGANQWIVDTVLSKCNANRQNNYLFLTKFSENMRDYFCDADVMPRLEKNHLERFSFGNLAFGVSVCCNADIHRIADLKETGVIQHRFVAFEPLLEEIDVSAIDLDGIEWVIVGAETGDEPRPCRQEWMKRIVARADEKGIPVFVNAVHTDNGKVTTEFDEMDGSLRRCEIPFAVK